MLDNADACTGVLRALIRKRLGLEPEEGARPPPPKPAPPRPPPRTAPQPVVGIDPKRLEKAVTAWWRRVVLEHHPDRGGDHKVFVALNNAQEELRKFLNDLK